MIEELVGNPLYEQWLQCGLVRAPWGMGWEHPYLSGGDALLTRSPSASMVESFVNTHQLRAELCDRYAWAVPSPEALQFLAGRFPWIVEIGAGRGYWGRLLNNLGVDFRAYDAAVRWKDNTVHKNHWHHATGSHTFFPVSRADHNVTGAWKNRALMLCWPPYNDPMAYEALLAYRGSSLIYIGEGSGGCTADDQFHGMLEDVWDEVEHLELPAWPGIRDSLMVYRRKGT